MLVLWSSGFFFQELGHFGAFKDTLCWCCSIDHKAPDGSGMACDRQVVFKCITTWLLGRYTGVSEN